MKEKNVKPYESRFIDKNGEIHYVETHLKTLKKEGKIFAFNVISHDITERKKAEEELQRSRESFKTLTENSPDLIIRLDRDLRYVYINSTVTEKTGKPPEYYIGKTYEEAEIPGKYATAWKESNLKALETGEIQHQEFEFPAINGLRFIESTIVPEFNVNGEIESLLVVSRDITESKKMENALKESEEKFRELFNKANDTITLGELTEDGKPGKFIEVNDAASRNLGYSTEELLNMTPLDIIQKEIDKAPENARKIFKTGSSKFETVHITKDGSKIPVEVNTHLFKFRGKDVILGISRDITERKKAEEEIKNRSTKVDILNRIITTANRSDNIESLLSDVLNLTLELMNFEGGGIYLINEDTKIAKIIHYKGLPEDFIETVYSMPINEYPYSEVFINGKSMFMDRYDKLRPEYSQWQLKSGATVPIYSKNKIIGAFNIANRKLHYFKDDEKQLIKSIGREIGNTLTKLITEDNLKKTIEKLELSNEELRSFAYVASHDLQEPLRTIASFTQLLERRYKGQFDEDADEFMDFIVEAAIRMKAQIEGLLEYSRIATKGKELKMVNINEILNQTINNLNTLIKESNAEITFEELPIVMGDADQLQRVFQNLI